ncbi:hypothetical protein [Enterocloster sp.]
MTSGADLHSMNRYYDEYNSGVNADRTVVTGQVRMPMGPVMGLRLQFQR